VDLDLDLDALTDAELRWLLDLPPAQDGLRHYMRRQDKVAFIRSTDEAERQAILDRARERQLRHHDYLRESRPRAGCPRPDPAAVVAEVLGGRRLRFVGKERSQPGERDPLTRRKGVGWVYVLEDIESGERWRVARRTVALASMVTVIEGWSGGQRSVREVLGRDRVNGTSSF
jgi:hypothetical protein